MISLRRFEPALESKFHSAILDFDEHNAFLIIFVHDSGLENTDVGIECKVAELCCSIVAGNRFRDGFVTEQRLQISDQITNMIRQQHEVKEGILYGKEYYFYLVGFTGDPAAGLSGAYPVFPNVQNYTFSHGKLPDSFQQARHYAPPLRSPLELKGFIGAYVRDANCIVSRHATYPYIEGAHLVPKKVGDWFRNRNMIQYERNEELQDNRDNKLKTEDIANVISLNPIPYTSMDHEQFAIVPRSDGL